MPYLLQKLLENTVQDKPDKEAVIDKNRCISYVELYQLSNQLAYVLKQRGVKRGDRVGIYLNKSIEAVIAIFGVLKAEAIYVPLDPAAPAKRIAFIIYNCKMKGLVSNQQKIKTIQHDLEKSFPLSCIVLTDQEITEELGELKTTKVSSWQDVLESPSTPLPARLIERDLAYILYTSGSTGTPKGVMISHRASLTFVNWSYQCFDVQPRDRVANHAPFHFDLSIFDIFTTIKAGATVILVPPELSVFPLNLGKFIEEQQISIWYSVPSILTQLVLRGKLEQRQLSNLRTILFAGEAFPVKYLRQLMAAIPQAKYYNLYGPTETNVCTYYKVEPLASDRTEPIPIGKACANTEVFAVNDKQEVVESGQIGELYVRGSSLMSGYWGMPEKTQEVLFSFTKESDIGAEEVYRTGDIVQQNSNGNYLYLGRRDNMIKSRGYRIELGEIETVIYSHPVVEEAAVVPIPNEKIGNEIKAVVVIQKGSKLKSSELAAFCAERIPKYMIPGILEFRDALPKTSTGKVDRTRLKHEHFKAN